jgi:hypothetical protein
MLKEHAAYPKRDSYKTGLDKAKKQETAQAKLIGWTVING